MKLKITSPVQVQKPAEIAVVMKQPSLNDLLAQRTQAALQGKKSSMLADALSAKPNLETPPTNLSQQLVPKLAPLKELYVLIENVPDTLKQEIVMAFSAKMQALIDYIDTPTLPDALRDLKMYCDEHKELKSILRPYDIQLFVRAARKSYGMTVVAKDANKTKRGKKADQQNEIGKDALEILGSLDFGI